MSRPPPTPSRQPAPAPDPPTDQPAAPAEPAAPVVKADGYLATNIIGESVYNGTGDDAENIGDVNDIVLDKDGKAEAVIVGVGGFLGIGEKNVADRVRQAELGRSRMATAGWSIPATKEQLEALPEFDRRPYDPAPAPVASTDTGTATATDALRTDTTAAAPAAEPPADTSGAAPAHRACSDHRAAGQTRPLRLQLRPNSLPPPAPADQQAADD